MPVESSQVQSQRGAALIMALLIVGLVAAMAVGYSFDFDRHLLRSESIWQSGQARAYLRGAEALASYALMDDQQRDLAAQKTILPRDHLEETWAQRMQPFSVEGGQLQDYLVDAQGRFNLNTLVHKAQNFPDATTAQRFTEPQRRFIRLLQALDNEHFVALSEMEALSLTEALIDWLDTDDDVTGLGGAERYISEATGVEYSAANEPLSSITELRLLPAMTPELYQALAPFVVALPQDVGLNINTASSTVLRSLGEPDSLQPLTEDDGEWLAQIRGHEGFGDIQQWLAVVSERSLTDKQPLVTEGLQFSSEYFVLRTQANLGARQWQSQSLLHRQATRVSVLRRSDFEL